MSTKLNQQRDHYSLRKFKSAGLASALIGVSTISFLLTNNKPVKAAANSGEPNEEANNDAMHKEQQDDIQSGTTTTTTETRQAPTTKITPLKPKKQTDKQEPAKEQTKPEESKPKEKPAKEQTKPEESKPKKEPAKEQTKPEESKPKEETEQAKKPVKQVEENKTAKTKKQAQTAEAKTPVEKQSAKEIHENLVKTNKTLNNNLKIANVPKKAQLKQKSSQEDKDNAGKKPTTVSFNTDTFTIPANYFKNNLHTILATSLFASSTLRTTSDTPLDIDAPDLSTWKQGTTTLKLRATIDSVDYDLSLNPKQTSNTDKAPFWDTVITDTKPDKDGHYKAHTYNYPGSPYTSNAQNTSTGFDFNSHEIGGATSMHLQSGPTYYYNIRPNVQEIARVYKLDDNGSKLTAIDQLSTNGVIEHAMYVTAGTKGYDMPEANMQLDTDLDGNDYVPIYTDGNHGAYIKGNITLWLQPVAGVNMSAHKWPDHSKTSTRYSLDKEAGVKVLDNADTAIWYELKGMHINPGQTKMYGFRETLFANGLDPTKQGNLLVNYVDEHNNDLAKGDTHVYDINTRYHTTAKKIPGYHLINYPNNANGIIKAGSTQVIYQYHKNMPKQIGYKVIDDDSNGREISHGILNGMSGEELHVNPVTNINIPNNYVLKDFNTFNYGMITDDTNPDVIIHVKHKIIGTANNLTENAHNERDYFIDQVRSKADPNITIIHDQDKDYQAKYNDVNEQNDKINQISQDYINQTTTIANQIEDYNKKLANDQQPPKLELHYHNDNLQLTKTSTYQVIEKMPSPKYGKDQTILKTTITAGKDIARDLVTGKTQETQFTGRNTHGNVDIGQTDGVDQTVIWGKQPTITGYHFNPFQAETKEHFDHIGGTDWTDHGAILSVSSTDNTIHFDYLVGQNYQSATNLGDSLILSDLPDSQTWYVTLSPNQQNTQVIYVDDDANGKQVGSQAISGLTDQETDHIFLDQFDHSKYTIDGNHLSKSDIQSDQLDGSITNYNVYEQTSPDYANYNFVNIYNKHNNQWTNVTSDSNNRLIVHLKEKTIGTTDPGNIIDPIHNLKGENVGPNITWIQDPNRETVVNDDQAAIDNALNNIANDYNTQEESIRNQLKDYYNRLNEYNQKRGDFIKDLQSKGLWTDQTVDPTTIKQNFHLELNQNIVPTLKVLDPSVGTLNGNIFTFTTDNTIPQAFLQATYDNLQGCSYRGKTIKKMVLTLSGVKKNAHNSGGSITVANGLNNGIMYNNITGQDLDMQFYDDQDNLITFGDDAYITIGSLNGYSSPCTECAQILSDGEALSLPQSGVVKHDNNQVYMDDGKTWPGAIGLDHSFDSWDNSTQPNRIFGSASFHFKGSHLKMRAFLKTDLTTDDNAKGIYDDGWHHTPTFIWSTMTPQTSFDAQAPKLEIHYHTNSLRSNTNRKYSVTYTYPPEVSSYYDNYTYADIVQAHRYVSKNLVTGQKTYSHYYGDRVSDDITQNKALRLNWNNIYGFTTKSDIPDGAIINNNQGIAITKDHMAFNNDFDNLADSYNYHIYYTPGEVLAKAQFIDEDTGQLVQENPFYGYVGQTVDVSNIPVPKNYRIADDSSKPDTYKMLSSSDSTAPDDQGFIVYVVQDTQTVQDAPRNIHIVVNGHDNLSGDITYTRDGIYNKVTGQTTWNPWTVYNSSASLNGMTDMYTLNGADIADLENNNINYTVDANGSRIANGTLTQDNSNYDLALSPDSPYFDGKTDLTYVINLNTVPANKEQYIIYEDRETHEQLGESSIKGPVGSQQSYTIKHFDGYLDPQGLPPTLEIKEDDTPYVIYLDRLAVYIPANNPVNEGDSIHDYDGDYVGDDTLPGGLNEGTLNHYVTRTIYVTKNGQTTKNVTTYHFTRNAYYYPANGEIKYTDWSPDQTFPVFKLDHNGVTPIVEGSQTDANGDIPAVTVGTNDSDITIDVSYESNDKGITLIWQDSDMSNREIRRRSMSIDQFKQSDNPEKAVLPDFKYTDEDHPQTFNDYSKNFNFKLEDTDGNILAQGDLSNLKSVGSLLKEKNNGYLLIFSKAHGYQYVQNSPNDEYPPIKSTYRIVNVTFPDGQTVQFRYGTRWKLADRRRDMTTGIKNAISNEGYIPASYIGTKDGTYPEINDEFIKNLLIQNGYVDDLSSYTIKADGDTSFMSLNADSPNEVVNVSFVGKRAGTKVEIVDTAGNVLTYNYLVGHIGQTLDINYPDIPAGYSNAGYAYYPKTYTFTKEHPDPIIVRVAKTGYANGQSVPTDRNLTTNSNGDTRSNNIKHANMFTSLFVMPQNQGQSSGTSQNNKPHSLQDQLQNLKTSKQQKHFNQSRSNAQSKQDFTQAQGQAPKSKQDFTQAQGQAPKPKQDFTQAQRQAPMPKQDFTQAQGQAPKPKSNFTRVKPNKINHNNAMDASLFVRSRGSSTAKLDDSHQDLLSKLSNLGAPKAAPVKHSNAQPVNTSSINHNFTTNQNLAQKLSNLKKTSYVQDRSVNVDPENNLDPTVEAATVEQDKTNAKDKTKKPDHSKEALVASLLGLSSAATAGAYAYKKKKNVKDETFNK